MEIGRGWVRQESGRRGAVSRAGAGPTSGLPRGFAGREEPLSESILGEALCRAEEALDGVGRTVAAARPIQLQRDCGSRGRTVAVFGRDPGPAIPGSGLVATTGGLALRTQPLRTESDHAACLGPHKEDEQQMGNRSFHARLPQGYSSSPTLHLQSLPSASPVPGMA